MCDGTAILAAEWCSTIAALDLSRAVCIEGGDRSDCARALADWRVAPTTTHVVACGLRRPFEGHALK